MKGKKFTAAEKHFEGKKKEYERKIKYLSFELSESQKETLQYKEMCNTLQTENEQLKQWVDRLLEYTELSEKDIKEACEKDKRMEETAQMLTTLFKFGGFY